MVAPLILAGVALGFYLLTKKSDSDIYGKDSEPKKEIKKGEGNYPKYKGKLFGVSKKSKPKVKEHAKFEKFVSSKLQNPKLSNKELKEKLDKVTYKIPKGSDPNNPQNYKKTFIQLENYALDFKRRYEYVKISKTGNVILINNGKKKIAKVGYDEGNKQFMLRAEGSRYSVKI
jgi:hypothetical protein